MQGILMNGWCEKDFKAFELWRHEKVTKEKMRACGETEQRNMG